MIFPLAAGERKAPENMGEKSCQEIWRETISMMEEALVKIPEEKRAAYEQKIRQKMQAGKKLSGEELNYLRVYQPELYQSALRVENARKVLRTKLQSCKSKEEVDNVVSVQTEVLRAMEGDPDKEYMSAMVRHEVDTFKKSKAYARLPQSIEEGKKRRKTPASEKEIWKDGEQGMLSSNKMAVLGQMQVQCEQISQMAEPFVA